MGSLSNIGRVLAVPLFGLLLCGPVTALDLGNWGQIQDYLGTGAKAVTSLRKGVEDITPEEEHYIGRSVTAQIFATYPPYNDSKLNGYLNEVGGYLALLSDRPQTYSGYHFQLIRSDEVNAFAAPGGFILVTTGLYRQLRSEEELAGVLAHEISHVTLDHGLSAIRTSNLTSAFTLIGKTVLEERASDKAQMLGQLTDLFDASVDDIINELVVSGYSRDQEFAADHSAVELLYRAGYQPEGLARFLGTLADDAGNDAGFYKTHPAPADRLARVREQIADGRLYNAASKARDRRFAEYRVH